jgi:hypothetical protein
LQEAQFRLVEFRHSGGLGDGNLVCVGFRGGYHPAKGASKFSSDLDPFGRVVSINRSRFRGLDAAHAPSGRKDKRGLVLWGFGRMPDPVVVLGFFVKQGGARNLIEEWWAMRDSNPRPTACKAAALPLRQSPAARNLSSQVRKLKFKVGGIACAQFHWSAAL